MTFEPKPIDEAKPVKTADPKCPRCRQLLAFSHNVVTTPSGAIISTIWCSICGQTLSIQQIGQRPDAAARLVVPN
jgi:transcription elongation factor Elf1